MTFGYYLLEACSCLMRDGKRVDLYERGGGEKLGRVDGGETVIYYVRTESIFNKRKIRKHNAKKLDNT